MISNMLYSLIVVLAASTTLMAQPEVSVGELNKKTGDEAGVVLIDVRTPAEVEEGYIKGARNIDVDSRDFKKQVKRLDKTATYYLYCGSGVRSARAARIMLDMGFDSVYSVEGGMKAWKAAGYPVEGD